MQTATVVLQTLVPNARRIFRLLAENQLEGEGESGKPWLCYEKYLCCNSSSNDSLLLAAGMTVHDLFKACREQLLVANELALRSHLNEFRDHQLVQTRLLSALFCSSRTVLTEIGSDESLACRRGHDGVDILHIPLADAIIQQILEEVD